MNAVVKENFTGELCLWVEHTTVQNVLGFSGNDTNSSFVCLNLGDQFESINPNHHLCLTFIGILPTWAGVAKSADAIA